MIFIKKIKWLLILFLISLLGIVKAMSNDTNVRVDYLSNVYGNFQIGNLYYWNQIGLTYTNDKIAYCMEPGKWITETIYDSYQDFNVKNITEADKEYLEQVAYYGYEYHSHQTIKYYLATQELIWRYLGIKEMYWSTGSVHSGDRINVDHEKQVIADLILRNNNKPSFHNMTYEVQSGTDLELYDSNGVFEGSEPVYPTNHAIGYGGNHLTIHAGKVGMDTISFIRYPNSYKTSLIYTKNDSQALATLGLSSKVITNVNLNVKGFSLTLHKLDKDNKNNMPSGNASLEGAIYQLSSNLGETKNFKTDVNGVAILNDIAADNYILEEIKASPGYKLDKTKYPLSISSTTNLYINMDVYEEVITNEIEFIKVFSNNGTGVMTPEVNIKFGIYDQFNNLIKEITTNKYGSIKVTLPYGDYVVKQLTTSEYYEKIKDFNISVKEEQTETIKYVLSDALVSSNIRLIKVDGNDQPIKMEGITFKIKDMKTGMYIEQNVTYPHSLLVSEFVTDKFGVATIPYPLGGGDYEIEEIKAPKGYLKGDNVSFRIDENTEFINDSSGKRLDIKIKNIKPTGAIKVTKYGSSESLERNEIGGYTPVVTKKLLSGVQFDIIANADIISNNKLIYKKDDIVNTMTTESGVALVTNLPLGSYCVLEKKTVDNYQLDVNKRCFNLTYVDDITPIIKKELELTNYKLEHKLIIKKIGEELISINNNSGVYHQKELEGVTFSLIASSDIPIESGVIKEGTVIKDLKTNVMGIIEFNNLPIGKYLVKEKDALSGYINEEIIKEVVIDGKDNQLITVNNQKNKGSLLVTKIDSNDSRPLMGATFMITSLANKELGAVVTNKQGLIKVDELEYGTYYIKEIKAPDGYKLDNEKHKIIINSNKELNTLVISNSKLVLPNTSSLNKIIIYIMGTIGCLIISCFVISYFINHKKYE